MATPIDENSLGGTGGVATQDAPTGRNRDVLRTIQTAIGRGLHIGEGGLARAVRMAESIIDSDDASPRDRLRAGEFLAALAHKGIEVAINESKNERLDTGKPTENLTHAVFVKGIDRDKL